MWFAFLYFYLQLMLNFKLSCILVLIGAMKRQVIYFNQSFFGCLNVLWHVLWLAACMTTDTRSSTGPEDITQQGHVGMSWSGLSTANCKCCRHLPEVPNGDAVNIGFVERIRQHVEVILDIVMCAKLDIPLRNIWVHIKVWSRGY